MRCEVCQKECSLTISSKDNPYVSTSIGLGEPAYLIGVQLQHCEAHGLQSVTFPNMGEMLDMVGYVVAKKIYRGQLESRIKYICQILISNIEGLYPWLINFYDPTENIKPSRAHWFAWFEYDLLWAEYGSKLKLLK